MSMMIFELIRKKVLPKFDELDKNCFIWLPLVSVPIDEHLPIDSMSQPALRMFNLLTWTAISPYATDVQIFMRDLALEHGEMGYFLLHYQDILGIIGVDEYGAAPGRAVVFNGTVAEPWNWNNNASPLMLDLVYSELKYPCKTFLYSPGAISHFTSIKNYSHDDYYD